MIMTKWQFSFKWKFFLRDVEMILFAPAYAIDTKEENHVFMVILVITTV